MSLFNKEDNIFHVQYSEFIKQIKSGKIDEIVLTGCRDQGFYIIGNLKTKRAVLPCILVNQRSAVRFIKCPDNAHSFLYNMGVNEFEINVKAWDMDSTYNPHKVSHESRMRKKRRENSRIYSHIYIDKYRESFKDIDGSVKNLVAFAIERGWLEESENIPQSSIATWFKSTGLPNYRKVPTWALKSAVLLTTKQGVYPCNDQEMSVFACLWFDAHREINNIELVKKSLPSDFISTVKKNGVSMGWMETVFNDEIKHVCHIERK